LRGFTCLAAGVHLSWCPVLSLFGADCIRSGIAVLSSWQVIASTMLVREIGYGDGNLAGRCGRRVPVRSLALSCGYAAGVVSELREDTGAQDSGSAWRAEAGGDWRDLGERAQGMTREEYADYMRALPAEEPGEPPEPPAAADLSFQRLGERAQGMTREEYADYMRQGPAAGGYDRVGAGWPRPGEGTIRDERARAGVLAPATGDAAGGSRGDVPGAAGPDARGENRGPGVPAGERAEVSSQPDRGDPPGPGGGVDVSPEAARIAELEALLAQKDGEIARKDAEIARKDADLSEAYGRLDQVQGQLDRTEGELGQTRDSLGQANREIAELKAGGREAPSLAGDAGSRPGAGLLDRARAGDEQAITEPDQVGQESAGPDADGQQDSTASGDAQRPADTGQAAADTNQPEQQAEDASSPQAQLVARKEIKVADQGFDSNAAERKKVRVRLVDPPTGIAIGGALWDARDAVQKIAAHGMHDAVSPVVGAGLGVVAVVAAKIQERRKENGK
jgi:hypothetical protein